ncbi:mannose PTS system EIIA component [Gammaproteobacteria bacterium]
MMVAILVITHDQVGRVLVDTAVITLGFCPLATAVLMVARNSDPDVLSRNAMQMAVSLDQGDGVLVLTDMYGSTPSNIACRLDNNRVRVVAGVNLPMLIRVFNYSYLSLDELTNKAVSGGRDGIIYCRAPDDPPTSSAEDGP